MTENRIKKAILKATAVCMLFLLVIPMALGEEVTLWDCPACGRTGNAGNFCGGCAHPAPWLEPKTVDEPEVSSDSGVMSHDDFAAAETHASVTVDTYVQAVSSLRDNKISVYARSKDGSYFIHNMTCTEEEAEKLVSGIKIRVSGLKAAWAGMDEIEDASFEFIEDAPFIANPMDVSDLIDACAAYMDYQQAEYYYREGDFERALELLQNLRSTDRYSERLAEECDFELFCKDVSPEKKQGDILRGCYRYIFSQQDMTREARQAWANRITIENPTGIGIAESFLNAPQLTERASTDEEKAAALCDALLYNQDDGAVKQACIDRINAGMSMTAVLDYLAKNDIYRRLCSRDGYQTGEVTITENRDKNYKVSRFITECYELCFVNRSPDAEKLNFYATKLLNKSMKKEDVMIALAISDEAKADNPTNEDYVRMLYRMVQRRTEIDEEGFNYWVGWLGEKRDGHDRKGLIREILRSDEYRNGRLCNTDLLSE